MCDFNFVCRFCFCTSMTGIWYCVWRYLHNAHLTSTVGKKFCLVNTFSRTPTLMRLFVLLPRRPITPRAPAEWARLREMTWWWSIHCVEWWGWNVCASWMRQSCQVLSVVTSTVLSSCWLRRLLTWSLAVFLRRLILPPACSLSASIQSWNILSSDESHSLCYSLAYYYQLILKYNH